MSKLISSLYGNVIVSTSDIESMYIETKTDEPTSKFSIFFIAKSGKVFLMDDDISSYYDAVLKLRNIAYQIYHCDDLIYQIPKTNSLEDEIEALKVALTYEKLKSNGKTSTSNNDKKG